jgi:hypothetical protein
VYEKNAREGEVQPPGHKRGKKIKDLLHNSNAYIEAQFENLSSANEDVLGTIRRGHVSPCSDSGTPWHSNIKEPLHPRQL